MCCDERVSAKEHLQDAIDSPAAIKSVTRPKAIRRRPRRTVCVKRDGTVSASRDETSQ